MHRLAAVQIYRDDVTIDSLLFSYTGLGQFSHSPRLSWLVYTQHTREEVRDNSNEREKDEESNRDDG